MFQKYVNGVQQTIKTIFFLFFFLSLCVCVCVFFVLDTLSLRWQSKVDDSAFFFFFLFFFSFLFSRLYSLAFVKNVWSKHLTCLFLFFILQNSRPNVWISFKEWDVRKSGLHLRCLIFSFVIFYFMHIVLCDAPIYSAESQESVSFGRRNQIKIKKEIHRGRRKKTSRRGLYWVLLLLSFPF